MVQARDPAFLGNDGGQPLPRSGRAALIRVWLVWWLLCAGLWMVLDDTTVIPELVDGAVAAAIGATAAVLVHARSSVVFAAPIGWRRRWWVPLTQFIADLPSLVAVLARALSGGDRTPGTIRTIPFAIEDDPAVRAAQIALASIAGSFAPNTVVVAVDEAAEVLIVHELTATASRRGVDPLELG